MLTLLLACPSLAASGAVAIKGGNRQIFEQFLGRSGAAFKLNATVSSITKIDPAKPGQRSQWLVKSSSGGGTYDAVIFAAPLHQTGIELVNSRAAELVPEQEYVSLYVTFILTTAPAPLPAYFGLSPATRKMPTSVFGTFDTESAKKPAFNSLNYIKSLSPDVAARFTDQLAAGGGDWPQGTEWHVVKMFSNASVSNTLLDEVFGAGTIGKTVEKVWLAYPRLSPVTWEEGELADVRLDEGLFYINGFERMISCMETATVAAFNVVSLLLNDLFDYTSPKSWAEWDEAQL